MAALGSLHAPWWIQDVAALIELAVLGILAKTSFSIKRRVGRIELSFRFNQTSGGTPPPYPPYPPESPTNPSIKLPVSNPLPPSKE